MPSVVRSKMWYIRITAPWEFLKQKISTVREWIDYDGDFSGYHIGESTEKPHMHIALRLTSELQKQSMDKRLKELFQVKGSDYSSKPWDGNEDALSYMFHDKHEEYENHIGFTDDDIERLKARNRQVQKIVAEAKEKASNKVVDYVLNKIKDSGNYWSIRDIALEIWKGVHSGQFYHPGHLYKRYVEEIYCKQSTDEESLVMNFDRMFKIMYPNDSENLRY